jgi:hypothetical protein
LGLVLFNDKQGLGACLIITRLFRAKDEVLHLCGAYYGKTGKVYNDYL